LKKFVVKLALFFKIQRAGIRQIEGILRQYFYELPPSGLATNGYLNKVALFLVVMASRAMRYWLGDQTAA